jgi:hypothetical protein
MTEIIRQPNPPTPVASLFAFALGACCRHWGDCYWGGRLAVNRLVIRKASFGTLEVDELTVRKGLLNIRAELVMLGRAIILSEFFE